jgi:hypothetical protein
MMSMLLAESAAELAHALGTACGALGVDAEDAVLVAVERDRLPVALQVRDGGPEVVESRLGLDEAQLHQIARRVVDVDQQRAARPTAFEPRVVAAVDLDELAVALAAIPRLVRLGYALVPRDPQPSRPHPGPERLPGHADAVQLPELLLGERRAEVSVLVAYDGDDLVLDLSGDPPVARPTSLPRRQPSRPEFLEPGAQAAHLARRQAQQLSSLRLRQPALLDAPHDL